MSSLTPDEPVGVLLVEDNPGDVRLIREAFESADSAFEFHVVRNGEEAIEYFQPDDEAGSNARPDLVLLDLNLPRADGFTVLETLDRKLDYPPPPILILSSSETEADVVKSYENTANAYLTKPDDLTDFYSMANAIDEFWVEAVRHPPVPS